MCCWPFPFASYFIEDENLSFPDGVAVGETNWGPSWMRASPDSREPYAIPMASGLIAGEALVAVILPLPVTYLPLTSVKSNSPSHDPHAGPQEHRDDGDDLGKSGVGARLVAEGHWLADQEGEE